MANSRPEIDSRRRPHSHLLLIMAVLALPLIALFARGEEALRAVTSGLSLPGAMPGAMVPVPAPACGLGACSNAPQDTTSLGAASLGKANWETANLGVYDPDGAFAESPHIAIQHVYLEWSTENPEALAREFAVIASRERWPLVTVEPWPERTDGNDTLLADIAAGQYDVAITALCGTLQELNRPGFLRWGHEMELASGRYPWANRDPVAYIGAYRHVVERCRAVASQVFFIWSPAGNDGMERYWPGRDFADYVGISVFGFPEWDLDHYGRVRGFEENLAEKYARAAPFDRPILLAEVGVTGAPADQAAWMHEARESLSRYPQVRSVVYFNASDTELAWGAAYPTPDWRIDPWVFN